MNTPINLIGEAEDFDVDFLSGGVEARVAKTDNGYTVQFIADEYVTTAKGREVEEISRMCRSYEPKEAIPSLQDAIEYAKKQLCIGQDNETTRLELLAELGEHQDHNLISSRAGLADYGWTIALENGTVISP